MCLSISWHLVLICVVVLEKADRDLPGGKFKSSFNQVWGALHSMGQNFKGDISEKQHCLWLSIYTVLKCTQFLYNF